MATLEIRPIFARRVCTDIKLHGVCVWSLAKRVFVCVDYLHNVVLH